MSLSSKNMEVRNWWVYRMVSSSNRTYIGVTSNLIKRRSAYRVKRHDKDQPVISRSILKYGFDAHNFTVIDSFEGNTSYALGKEMFWIRTYMSNRSKFPEINGLNITDGGEGSFGAKRTIEQKKAQSIRTKGKKINRTFTEEDKQKLREHNSKYRHTDEAKKRIGEAAKGNTYCKGKKMHPNTQEALLKAVIGNKFNLGKKQSQQHKDRIREANTGKQRSKEFIEKQTENELKLRVNQ